MNFVEFLNALEVLIANCRPSDSHSDRHSNDPCGEPLGHEPERPGFCREIVRWRDYPQK